MLQHRSDDARAHRGCTYSLGTYAKDVRSEREGNVSASSTHLCQTHVAARAIDGNTKGKRTHTATNRLPEQVVEAFVDGHPLCIAFSERFNPIRCEASTIHNTKTRDLTVLSVMQEYVCSQTYVSAKPRAGC